MSENQSTSDFFELETHHQIFAEFTDFEPLASRGFNILVRAKRKGQWWILKGLKEDMRDNTVYQELLRKEFAILQRLQDKPAVVKVDGLEEVEGYGLCIVMEWIDGETLKTWLVKKHSKRERLHVADQLLDAVESVHQEQIVHRDLKPSNIMITRNGAYVKLIDFGLSDADSYAVFKQPAGTVGYMSQEQQEGGLTDVRNDIYSLSRILRDMNLGWSYRSVIKQCQGKLSHRYPDVASFKQAVFRLRRRVKIGILCLVGLLVVFLGDIAYNKVREATRQTYDVMTSFRIGNLQYESWGGGLVSVKAANQKDSCIEIPAQVMYRGLNYKVNEITFDAFKGNPILKSVVFPDGRFHVMRNLFAECPNMQEIFFRHAEPPYIGNAIWKTNIKDVFSPRQLEQIKLNVPKGSLQKYRKSPWGQFKHIEEYD